MSRRLTIARRELGSLSREKTIVLALLIQLFVAAFSSFLVVGLTTLYDPGATGGGEVEVGVTGDAAGELAAAMAGRDGVDAQMYDDRSEAVDAFQRGRLDAVAVATHDDHRIGVDVTVPDASLRKTLVVVRMRATLEAFERAERQERAEHLTHDLAPLPPQVSASPYFGFSYTVLVPLLLFLPTFIAGSTAVDSVTEEMERGTLELLRVAPLSLRDIIDGKGAAMVALAPAQAALWLGLLSVNGIEVANVGSLVAMTTGFALILVAGGVLLGLLVPSRQRAQLLYSLGTLAVFAVAALLPAHPATTVARLAIGSATTATHLSVVVYLAAGVAVAAAVRWYATRLDAERL
ncbi:ABC transporter permease [Halorarius halobius]|uniref:ABC transporter permease n=1 Tax=Halorarius halobius TaxID=2962671 RepID=UPI0020CBE0F5|nr:ABC transporter permease [Halorarius halobius]